jgi:hypothetical protein
VSGFDRLAAVVLVASMAALFIGAVWLAELWERTP